LSRALLDPASDVLWFLGRTIGGEARWTQDTWRRDSIVAKLVRAAESGEALAGCRGHDFQCKPAAICDATGEDLDPIG
jgi:hypothetical protein